MFDKVHTQHDMLGTSVKDRLGRTMPKNGEDQPGVIEGRNNPQSVSTVHGCNYRSIKIKRFEGCRRRKEWFCIPPWVVDKRIGRSSFSQSNKEHRGWCIGLLDGGDKCVKKNLELAFRIRCLLCRLIGA